MESRGVQQESRAFTERRDRGGVFPAGDRTCQAVYVRRTLYRGRDADRGLGEPQELPADDRAICPAGRLSLRSKSSTARRVGSARAWNTASAACVTVWCRITRNHTAT